MYNTSLKLVDLMEYTVFSYNISRITLIVVIYAIVIYVIHHVLLILHVMLDAYLAITSYNLVSIVLSLCYLLTFNDTPTI